MLKRLYVDNYRSLVNFECILSPRQLILGANGSGKSSLFEVLAFLRDVCGRNYLLDDKSVAARIGTGTHTRWQQVSSQTFELDVAGNGGVYHFRLVIEDNQAESSGPRIVEEVLSFDGSQLLQRSNDRFEYSRNENRRAVLDPSFMFPGSISALGLIGVRDESRIGWFKKWLAGLLVITPDPKLMSGVAQKETSRPEQSLANFADWYRHIKLDEDDQEYSRDLAEILEGFVRFRLEEVGASQSRNESVLSPVRRVERRIHP